MMTVFLTFLAFFFSAIFFGFSTVETVKVLPLMIGVSVSPVCTSPKLAVQLPASRLKRDVDCTRGG
jgi:hypothetical protein